MSPKNYPRLAKQEFDLILTLSDPKRCYCAGAVRIDCVHAHTIAVT